MKVQITFRSGAQAEFEAAHVVAISRPAGGIDEFRWTRPDDPSAPQLLEINPAEIAAIVTTRDSGDT